MLKKIIKLFQSLSVNQCLWVWSAYWRLWLTLLRIKFNKPDWLWNNVQISSVNAQKDRTDKMESLATSSAMAMALSLHAAIKLAARLHFMTAACLPRSLVLVQMLEQRGETALVRIGVAKTKQGIASHAWVELDGIMVAEAENVSGDFTLLGVSD